MSIAIIGGGITGLTTAYELTKYGNAVTIFEKEKTVGGLARGYKKPSWQWHLEYTYHHLFTNDTAIINLAKDLKLKDDLLVKRPITATLWNSTVYQLDSLSSLLSFPGLSFAGKLRTGIFLASMKVNPIWKPLEWITAKHIAITLGGKEGWQTIWEPLMVGKFGEYADRIAASWLWARIVKRTPKLIYFRGGFHTFITTLENAIQKRGGTIITNARITSIQRFNNEFSIMYNKKQALFDKVLLTIPTPLALSLTKDLDPQAYRDQFQIPHLHAQVLVLETATPILNDIYWLNITDRSFPFLAVVAHTNFIDPSYYGGKHLTYIGNYLPSDHSFLSMNTQNLLKIFTPYIQKLNPTFSPRKANATLFIGPFAQPVHELRYSRRAPTIRTPIPNLYFANMDAIFPWDRGTNYAVELGQIAAKEMMKT